MKNATNVVSKEDYYEGVNVDNMSFAKHHSDDNEWWIKNLYVNNEDFSFEDELLDDINVD